MPVQIGQIMLAGSTVSWSERVNHPRHILAKRSKVAFCSNLTPSQSLYLRVVPFCTAVLNTSKISVASTLSLIQYVPASYFPVSSPLNPLLIPELHLQLKHAIGSFAREFRQVPSQRSGLRNQFLKLIIRDANCFCRETS